MSREENFPISSEIVEKFVEVNKSKWTSNNENDGYVIVNFSMVRLQAAWIIPKLIYARGMADKTNSKVVVFTWRNNQLLTDIITSFGFEHIVIDEMIKDYPTVLIKSVFKTLGFEIADGTGMGLRRLKINGLTVGQSMYEDILRTSTLSTIKSARQKIVIKKMIHLLSFYYGLDKYTKDKKINGAIIDDIAYHEGFVIKLMDSKNCPIIMQMNGIEKREIIMSPKDRPQIFSAYLREYIEKRIDEIDTKEACDWADKFLQERFKGKNGRAIDRGAFENKKVLSREELAAQMGMDNSKKNVVIMAHTFTDAVFNYGDYFFRDYYDWMEKTLEIASTIDDVNWILKPHPTRHAYNEDTDSIEAMFERISNGKKNMFLLSDEISSEVIVDLADVQVTIGGNSGGEYSCFGIPTIIIGKPYYSGFGYTIEPESFEEYKALLANSMNIEKLSDEMVTLAKKVFYVRMSKDIDNHFYKFKDEFGEFVNSRYYAMINKIALSYFNSNEGTKEYNDEILKDITDYIGVYDIKESDYYRQGLYDSENVMR